ncbi:hypothetical protein D9758_014723 [Tetrapyrgos nigripes]|uniref:Uncharacterized protein n=1 Tax=Tetrapyrgos nigripes TaxID=182062 RepID=A0A8H5CAI4_9AGAR|nr:hypothetical protein D9758_014723 [Tetrapyrgos nigripes]
MVWYKSSTFSDMYRSFQGWRELLGKPKRSFFDYGKFSLSWKVYRVALLNLHRQALVKILKQDSRPRLKDLMRKLSSETEALLDRMFRELREWDRKTGQRSTVQKAYQNPQLSSDIPADMNHCFEL